MGFENVREALERLSMGRNVGRKEGDDYKDDF